MSAVTFVHSAKDYSNTSSYENNGDGNYHRHGVGLWGFVWDFVCGACVCLKGLFHASYKWMVIADGWSPA